MHNEKMWKTFFIQKHSAAKRFLFNFFLLRFICLSIHFFQILFLLFFYFTFLLKESHNLDAQVLHFKYQVDKHKKAFVLYFFQV